MKKIFELEHEDGEKEWFTGQTNVEALAAYLQTTSCDIEDLGLAKLTELPRYKWSKYRVKEEDEDHDKTFAQWMKENPHSTNDIIAGTMYEV